MSKKWYQSKKLWVLAAATVQLLGAAVVGEVSWGTALSKEIGAVMVYLGSAGIQDGLEALGNIVAAKLGAGAK